MAENIVDKMKIIVKSKAVFLKRILIVLICFFLIGTYIPAIEVMGDETAGINGIGGESITLGIADYQEGALWKATESKTVVANIDQLSQTTLGNEYKVKVTVPKGMRLFSFPWSNTWGTKPVEVAGVTTTFANGIGDLLSGNQVSRDSGGKTTLIYTIKSSTIAVDLSGSIFVTPDEYYAYNGDQIPTGVKVELLNGAATTLGEKAINVTVSAAKIQVNQIAPTYALSPGNKGKLANITVLKSDGSYGTPHYFEKAKLTIKLPSEVESVEKLEFITGTVASMPTNFTYNASTQILTLTWDTPFAQLITFAPYGKIKNTATLGTKNGVNWDANSFQGTCYDGHVMKTDELLYFTGSHYLHNTSFIVEAADTAIKFDSKNKTHSIGSQKSDGGSTL